MKRTAEAKASTIDLAVEHAIEELGVSRENVEVEVISKGGLFSKAHVKVTTIDTAAIAAEDFVNGILSRMNLQCRAKAVDDGGTITIEISGEGSGTAIGYRGEALDAFQYLILTYLNQEKYDFKKVVVDSENYREKRKETLTALALRLAEKAHRTCKKVVLEPMNPFERRVIHSALADSEIAETVSEGEDSERHVVIIPKGVEIRPDRPRHSHDNKGKKFDKKFDKKGDRRGDKPRAPREEEPEVPDGKIYRLWEDDGFVKPEAPKQAPKFKSFGGDKR